MVRLVLVSHSRSLAEALVAFVRQMAGEEVSIGVAAGTEDEGQDFGTDAMAIVEAITSAPTDDGVLVLMDVGSAVMSAEMALEFLDASVRERVILSAAPFVEGTLAAAVQASLGASLDEVVREAETALEQKRDALSSGDVAEDRPVSEPDVTPGPSSGDRHQITVVLPNEHGLHARPAAQFVRSAAAFDAQITVENQTAGRGPVSATSISQVARLAAEKGHELRLSAEGPEAESALDRLRQLIHAGFGELGAPSEPSREKTPENKPEDVPRAPEDADRGATGRPVVPGVAVGPAVLYRPSLPELPTEPSGAPDEEWHRVQEAVESVRASLQEDQETYAQMGSEDVAGILDAQQLLLQDETLLDSVHSAIREHRQPAARAWMAAIDEVAQAYAEMDDAYLAGRAVDVRDVGRRVVRKLLGETGATLEAPDTPFLLVAESLAPSDVHTLPDHVAGVVCAAGNPTSHSAILLRSRGIPTVFDAGRSILDLSAGTRIGLNGSSGEVWTNVDDSFAQQLEDRAEEEQRQMAALRTAAQSPAETLDGLEVVVEANVNQPMDAVLAYENGADGVGLLRTEFLFVDRDAPPTEDEQVEHLSAVVSAVDGRPVTVRVLDVGGDKPIPYVSLPSESNPFLGLRGIRVLLRHPSLFQDQLCAILRVAAEAPIRLLLPMIASPTEVRQTRDHLETARSRLRERGAEVPSSVEVGAMIETPASAVTVGALAEVVDFFSIGTNDLTQYTMAVDREHADLAELSDALAPPVLALLQHIVEETERHDRPVSLCGELAADAEALPILLGLGLRRLSVAPPALPSVKAGVRSIDTTDAADLAQAALSAESAKKVRTLSREFLADRSG